MLICKPIIIKIPNKEYMDDIILHIKITYVKRMDKVSKLLKLRFTTSFQILFKRWWYNSYHVHLLIIHVILLLFNNIIILQFVFLYMVRYQWHKQSICSTKSFTSPPHSSYHFLIQWVSFSHPLFLFWYNP